MKHLKFFLLISFLLTSMFIKSQSQSHQDLMDSLQTSVDPGSYYLNYLQAQLDSTEADTAESSRGKELRRCFSFWADRLPIGEGITDPVRKYCQAQIAVNPFPCTPKVGDFNGNWENVGPNTTNQASGIVYDILPDDQNNFWVGVQFGGLWRVTNGIWTCVTDAILPAGTGVESIVRSPFNPNEMYFGTFIPGAEARDQVAWAYGHGLWKSTNGGVSWALQTTAGVLDDFSRVSHITYSPNLLTTSQEMILAVELNPTTFLQGNRLLRKIGGGGWVDVTPAGIPPLNVTKILFLPDQPGVFYIATDAAPSQIAYIYKFTYNTTTGAIGAPIVIANDLTLHQFNFTPTPPFTNITSSFWYDLAYAGGGKIYIGASGQNTNEGCWNMLEYQSTAANLPLNPATSTVISMALVTAQTRNMMHLAVSQNSPDIVYFGGIRPFYVSKPVGTNTWIKTNMPGANQQNYHDDTRCVKILTSIATNPLGASDVVFWGNDGGVSMTNGSNCINKNGSNFFGQQIYDVDVSQAGKKRVAAAMHSRMFNTTSNPTLWQNQAGGDGFNSIYDDRTPHNNQSILYHNGSLLWDMYTHNNVNAFPSFTNFQSPRTLPWERERSFIFPNGFEGSDMYLGNKNLWKSQPNGYEPWIKVTNNGALLGTAISMYNNCRAMALAPSLPTERQYFAFRYLHTTPMNTNQSNKKMFVKYQGLWKNITYTYILNNDRNITDIAVDDKNPNRFFISLANVNWGNPGQNRVLVGDFDPILNDWVYDDMSQGLTELPVLSLVYQHGSDDIIYAGTDAGVYRWDKPQGCWVKFDGTPSGSPMADVLVHDMEIDYCSRKLVIGTYGRGIWETDLYEQGLPGYTDIIPNNTVVTWGSLTGTVITDKYIKGSVLVKSGATLRIYGVNNMNNTHIYMPKWGKIDVEKGAKLIVEGATITNDCGAMWLGIYAHGDGWAPQQINPAGFDPFHGIVEIGKANIEYAEEAVNNFGGSSANNTGGILKLFGSKFYNNRRSVSFLKYENWVVGGNIQPDLALIENNEFDVDDNIRIPFFTHATMWGVRGVRLFDNNFYNHQNLNQSHQRALYTIDATYRMQKTGSITPIIEGFHTGVESTSFQYGIGNLHPIIIYLNKFDKNEIGIHFNTITDPIIRSNSINIGAKQTPLPGGNSWSYYSLGSKLVNVNRFEYAWNFHHKLYNAPVNGVFQYTAGTEVYKTGTDDENIQSNTYVDLLIGNDCADVCGDGQNSGLNYRCNWNFNNTKYDFILQHDAIVRPIQSNNLYPTGNILSQNNFVSHWTHTVGGNSPVDYYMDPNNFNEILTNFSNVNPISVGGGSGCPVQSPPLPSSSENPIIALGDEIETYEQLNTYKVAFENNKTSYLNFSNLYNQLIDLGNTQDVLFDIDGSDISDQLAIRTEMLNMSPYVSEEVLRRLATSNTVSNPILFEIIMANPDASKSDGFIEFLQELANPLPSYMLNLIKQSWTGSTARTLLQKNISASLSNMTENRNLILRTYLSSANLANKDSAYLWLGKIKSLNTYFQMADYQLSLGNAIMAQEVLDSIPANLKLSDKDSVELIAFRNLFNFKKTLIMDSIRLDRLDSNKIAALYDIAESNENTTARSMARNALCFFYQICYPDSERVLPQASSRPIGKLQSATENNLITAYPNPSHDFIAFQYNLPLGAEATNLDVVDMVGHKVYSANLKGNVGQHIWDVRQMKDGIYIYTVTTKSGEKYSGKITVKK